MHRFYEIDALRGIAIALMVAFHFLFDLNLFAGFSFDLWSGPFFLMGRLAAITFVFLVGLSLTLSYGRAKEYKQGFGLFRKYLFRGSKIFALGLPITLFTLFLFPEKAILFGILHLIGLSIILAFPFIKRPKASLALGLASVAVGFAIQPVSVPFPWLLWLGLKPAGFASFDYAPLLPWFGFVLLGIFTGNLLYPNGKRRFWINEKTSKLVRFLSFLGRHSLLIYFLHQPVLVALVLLLLA